MIRGRTSMSFCDPGDLGRAFSGFALYTGL